MNHISIVFLAVIIVMATSICCWRLWGSQCLLDLLPFHLGVCFLLSHALHLFFVLSFLFFGVAINSNWSCQRLFLSFLFFFFLCVLLFLKSHWWNITLILNYLRSTPCNTSDRLKCLPLVLLELLSLEGLHLFMVLGLASSLPLALMMSGLYAFQITFVNFF